MTEITELQDSIKLQKENFSQKLKDKENELLEKAKDKAKSIEENAVSILKDAENKAEVIKKEKLAEIDSLITKAREEEKKRLADQAIKEKELLAKLRTQELENLKIKREQEDKDLAQRKEEYAETIVKGVENLVVNALKSKGSSQANFDFENLNYLVRACILDKKPEENQLLKKLNPYGKAGQGKSNVFWKKVGIAFGAGCFIVILHLVFPGLFGGIFSSVGDSIKVENSAKDLYLEDLRNKEKNKYSFNPIMTDSYKKSLTENVLYNKKFNELYISDDFQKDWTVKVDSTIVYSFKLKDYKVVDYISEEFKMVRDLIAIRGKINQMNKDDKIQEMHKREKEGRAKLLKLLENKRNMQVMEATRKSFFIQYKNSH